MYSFTKTEGFTFLSHGTHELGNADSKILALRLQGLDFGSKGSTFKVFGPKGHFMYGFWAILSLRVCKRP